MLPCDSVLCNHCASTRPVLTFCQLISAPFFTTLPTTPQLIRIRAKNPGTLPLICFQHPSANKNSDLDVASDDNTALRKSERTMGTATIRRTNWVGIPRLDDFISRLHRGRRCVSIEGGLRPVVTRAFACSISRNSVAHRPSLLPHGRARTSDRAQSPIASQRVVGIADNTEHQGSISKLPDDVSSLPNRLEGIPRDSVVLALQETGTVERVEQRPLRPNPESCWRHRQCKSATH